MELRKLLALSISFLSIEAMTVAPAPAKPPNANQESVETTVADQDAVENDLMSMDLVWNLPDLSTRQKSEITRIQQQFKSLIHPLKEEMFELKSQVSTKKKHKRGARTQPSSEIGGAIMAGLIKVERPHSSDKSKSETEPAQDYAMDKTPDGSAYQKDKELIRRAKLIKQKIKQMKGEAWSQIMSQLTPAQKSRLQN